MKSGLTDSIKVAMVVREEGISQGRYGRRYVMEDDSGLVFSISWKDLGGPRDRSVP